MIKKDKWRVEKSASCKCKVKLPTIDQDSGSSPSKNSTNSGKFIALGCRLLETEKREHMHRKEKC